VYYWEYGIMMYESKIIRVSEDFSHVEAEASVFEYVFMYNYKDVVCFKIGELYVGVFYT
jgi:hypothetical protein